MKPVIKMKFKKTLTLLTLLIALLALLAAGTGVFYQGEGTNYTFTSLRGEAITIYGHGIYRYDPLMMVAQGIPQDMVTLLIGIPLLLVGLWLYRQGRLLGHLLLAGTLAYFLYTYTSMAFGTAFNQLFLVYVALFSLSLFAFILAMVSVDVATLPAHFGDRLPRRWIAGFLIFGGAFLLLAWLGRIIPAQLSGATPFGLATSTTLFIQVLDLGVIVPSMFLAAILLLQRRPFGYLLAAVMMIKFMTMGLALVAMIIGQWLAGVPMATAEVVIFCGLAVVGLAMTAILLRSLRETGTQTVPMGVK
jgi:hypothetical protein